MLVLARPTWMPAFRNPCQTTSTDCHRNQDTPNQIRVPTNTADRSVSRCGSNPPPIVIYCPYIYMLEDHLYYNGRYWFTSIADCEIFYFKCFMRLNLYCQHVSKPSGCGRELVKSIIIIIYYFRVFHISVSWWFFTGVWVTASLLKSPGLVSGSWPFSAMLSFG